MVTVPNRERSVAVGRRSHRGVFRRAERVLQIREQTFQ
jgi:hypothetical protein